MPRHHYRSQPALQRSGGQASTVVVGLCLLAGIAVGAGVLVSTFVRDFEPASGKSRPAAPADAPAPLDAAAPLDSAATPPITEPPLNPQMMNPQVMDPQVTAVLAPPEPPQASPAPTRVSKARNARNARPASRRKPPEYPPFKAITPQQQWDQWEQQKVAYDRARASYDARERSEGYRWAQENRIRVQRYCRAAAGRTAAFMEGCISYVRPGQTKASNNPIESATPDRDQFGRN